MKFSSAPSNHDHRVFRRDSYVASGYKAEEAREKRAKLVALPAAAIIRYADGKGRVYDLASKAWCDGNNHCWTGKYAWTFKDGTWFYGSNRWYEAEGTWRTDAAEAPVGAHPVYQLRRPHQPKPNLGVMALHLARGYVG